MNFKKILKTCYKILITCPFNLATKILRAGVLIILFMCVIWTGIKFYEQINFELVIKNPPLTKNFRPDKRIKMLTEKAITLKLTRLAGLNLANILENMNLRLFNDEPEVVIENPVDVDTPQNFQAPDIKIKALMLGDGVQSALVDTPSLKGIIIKTGQKFLNGRVIKINSAGIIIDFGDVQVIYNAQ